MAKETSAGSGSGGDHRYAIMSSTASATLGLTSSSGGGGGHNHAINLTNVGSHTHTIADGRPPYYVLAFIQYKGT